MLKQKCPYRNDTETWKRPIKQKKKQKNIGLKFVI